MIYDCFIFNGEFDILDIRLNELWDTVDKFIIVEGDHTFQGNRKPLHFKEALPKYRSFMDKIIYLPMTPVGNRTWDKEAYSRDYIKNGLRDAEPDDIIMLSDADEIPRASAVEGIDPQEMTLLNMDEYYYGINLWHAYYEFTRVCYYRDFPGGQAMRRTWSETMPRIENAGWHFSFLMTPEQIANKIKSFAHDELNVDMFTSQERIAKRIETLQDPFDRDTLERREFENHPRYILDNLDRFGKYVL